jgi:hypothetical protein
MTEGECVNLETEEEKLCFKLINDLDHVNGHVPGSITQKKYTRNEIWSLISHTFQWITPIVHRPAEVTIAHLTWATRCRPVHGPRWSGRSNELPHH